MDDITVTGSKQSLAPMWKKLMKNVDIEESTSFLDHVYSGCSQRECKPNDTIIEESKKISNHVFLLEQQENYQDGKSHVQKFLRGPTTWKDMLENAWNDIAKWQTRRQSSYIRLPVLAWRITKLRKKNWKIRVNCHKFAHMLSWKCLFLEEIGRLDILWSVNNWQDPSQNGRKLVPDDWHD